MTERSAGLPSQQQVMELLDDEFARAGYEIEAVVVDAAARPPRITVVADGDEPLDLDTIAELSKRASVLLDTIEIHADAAGAGYVLEVSSPGVDRPLTAEKHFRRARGRRVRLTLSDGSEVPGRLGPITDGILPLVVKQRSALQLRDIRLEDVVGAVVEVEFAPPSARELELAGVDRGEACP